jgi:hypothetical protein
MSAMQNKRLSKEQRSDIAALAAMKDSDIDLTDMPEVLDWNKAKVGKFYRPGKKTVQARKKPGSKRKS